MSECGSFSGGEHFSHLIVDLCPSFSFFSGVCCCYRARCCSLSVSPLLSVCPVLLLLWSPISSVATLHKEAALSRLGGNLCASCGSRPVVFLSQSSFHFLAHERAAEEQEMGVSLAIEPVFYLCLPLSLSSPLILSTSPPPLLSYASILHKLYYSSREWKSNALPLM